MIKLYHENCARPCLVLAPHLSYPTRNGADILIDRRWAEFSHHVAYVDILGSNILVRYQHGVRISVLEYSNQIRSKLWSSLRTIAKGSHYLLERYITREFVRMASISLAKQEYGMIVYSHISTASLATLEETMDRLHCVETHNDEIKWYFDIRNSSSNLLLKLVAWLSEQWLLRFMHRHEIGFLYLHVTKADQSGFASRFPKHISYVAPVGCDQVDGLSIHEVLSMGRTVRLLFVGSLSVKMNYDAIKYFSGKFYPILSQGLAGQLEVRIMGSNPSAQVEQLCAKMGWELCANVSENDLVSSYAWADFSILPFAYATGGKLKLIKSLSLGVPFLATSIVAADLGESVGSICLVSDVPSEWLHQIERVRRTGIQLSQRSQLIEVAKKYSWKKIAMDLNNFIKNFKVIR